MKTTSITMKRQYNTRQGKTYIENCVNDEAEDEPPGKTVIISDLEEEPPGKTAANRDRFFRDIPDSTWSDWRWQFRNRITTIDELIKFVPLSPEERDEIRLVTKQYPLSITPYYLSLINLNDPFDPLRKQAIPSIQEIAMGKMGLEDPL